MKGEPEIVGPLKPLRTNLKQWGTGANRQMPEPLTLCQVILGGVCITCQSPFWKQAFISYRSKLDNENLTDVSPSWSHSSRILQSCLEESVTAIAGS